MKQLLVDTALGHWLVAARDKVTLTRMVWSAPEAIGTIANSQLASRLVGGLCRSGRTYVDVGAHIGSVIADVRRRSSPGHIVAAEAIPARAEALKRKFPNAEIFAVAIGSVDYGQVPFFVDMERSGYSSLGRPTNGVRLLEIQVPMRKLDSLVRGEGIDVIKIDVEGAELGVMRGATEITRRCRPIFMFESAPEAGERLGYFPKALFEHFESIDYAVDSPEQACAQRQRNDARRVPR